MAKSKTRARRGKSSSGIAWGGAAAKGTGRLNLALGVAAAAVLLGLGVLWWQGRGAEAEFLALAATGGEALARVETLRNDGGGHLAVGESRSYDSSTPTSGSHDPIPTEPGFYATAQRPTKLVHALEHGHIVIYYEDPGDETLARLKDWAALYDGHWDGVVATPLSGLGRGVVLTAWRKKLTLEAFDAAAAAAFIDEFRGRGPENPVR